MGTSLLARETFGVQMTLSMYNASVPVLLRGLRVLDSLLAKGVDFAVQQGMDEKSLVEARLAPDMLPLSGQVQRASDTAKFAASRLTGLAAPSFADEETSFAELRDRCSRTIAFLEEVDPQAFEGSETRQITFGAAKRTLSGEAYLLTFAIPNFFFHVTTAYDILRHKGVQIGKSDYLGPRD
jgi:uncharacterized protein